MIFEKPDGQIELVSSGCSCPPGTINHGQHTNCGTTWMRAKRSDGEWTMWDRTLSATSGKRIAEKLETVAEFYELFQE